MMPSNWGGKVLPQFQPVRLRTQNRWHNYSLFGTQPWLRSTDNNKLDPKEDLGLKAGVVKSSSARTRFRPPVGNWQAGRTRANTETQQASRKVKLQRGTSGREQRSRNQTWLGCEGTERKVIFRQRDSVSSSLYTAYWGWWLMGSGWAGRGLGWVSSRRPDPEDRPLWRAGGQTRGTDHCCHCS